MEVFVFRIKLWFSLKCGGVSRTKKEIGTVGLNTRFN